MSPDAGTPVEHPSWVVERLTSGPVIILDHSTGCAPCEAQTRDIDAVLARYPGQVTYLDVLADGSDQRAYDAFEAYDVNGGQHYIPLTVIVTRVADGSSSRIVWHSTEGATGAEWLDLYIRDAIYYHSKSPGASA